MHKVIRPPPREGHTIAQFPHCDSRVLHNFGECEFCDHYPEWQELRVAWGIAFTGWEPDDKELPCPATLHRPVETINQWRGNVASGMRGY